MSLKAFRKPPQATGEVEILSNAVADFILPLVNNPLLDGVLIKNIQVSTTKVEIAHSLGRPWVGWIVTNQNAGVTVYAITQTDRKKFLTLISTGTGNIDVYIF